ncbi:restriction modification enzyme subunit S2B [Mesomycoplasma dispar]|uniref:Restriction modification enzyme subunit S2B n=1 Tax=Mesomycoplasma dispar TaxID=86660 RepID=A0AAJ5TCU5_9BACT|nr:restriction endonuclease subunit S [Mesomycoplasma dispar]VEU62153.1 restriction modification enzyme subunit S2B [Mesomycoplasma dispar]
MIKIKEIFELIGKSEIKYFKISDLFEIKRGRVISKTYIAENPGKFPVYSSATQNNGEIGKISTFDFDGEFITWTTDGAWAGSVFYRNEKFNATNVCGVLKNKTKNNTKFLFYLLKFVFPNYVNRETSNPKLMSNVVSDIQIPVPPIEIQEKIAEILDNFTNLINTLKSENNIRNKQFSYYQKQFLSFLDFNTHTHREREREREQKGLQILYKNIQRTTFDLH